MRASEGEGVFLLGTGRALASSLHTSRVKTKLLGQRRRREGRPWLEREGSSDRAGEKAWTGGEERR
jgi:hypothetical protein